jgi:ABC-type multidrug transport system ATPase subunit
VVVILSTHIVDDVTDLCSQMAIIVGGCIVKVGEPQQLLDGIRGRIWRSVIDKSRLGEARERLDVISTRLRAGRTEIHVAADQAPAGDFEPVEATIEDLYFATLAKHRRAAAGAPA